MKKSFIVIASMLITLCGFSQVAYLQYRHVPAEHEAEFVEKETQYWSKVAKAAIDNGQMMGWSLWRKVGVTEVDAPNYVFVNSFQSLESIDQGAIWSEENLKKMGVSPGMVETNSISTVTFDYWMQLEEVLGGDYKYCVVNYAKPTSVGDFIQENKTLWKPLHDQNIKAGNMNMASWGLMSTIYPAGNLARFSCLTWDGFNSLADVMNYMRYQPARDSDSAWAAVMDKTKMGEIMPDGFEYRIIYELVHQEWAEN